MTHVIRLGNYEYPVIVDIDLPPGAWFLVRFEHTVHHMIARTNLGDWIVGDIDGGGQIHFRHEAERIADE